MTKDHVTLTVSRSKDAMAPEKIRIERVASKSIHKDKVLYRASPKGQYKGMVIHKKSDDIKPRKAQPQVQMEFTVFIANKNDIERQIKERRQLRFWFEDKVKPMEKTAQASKFFTELLDAETFPQTLVLFIKKALILVKHYKLIDCLDIRLERTDVTVQECYVEESCRVQLASSLEASFYDPSLDIAEEEGDDMEDVVRNYITVMTPAKYTYQFVPELPVNNKTWVAFKVRASESAHVALSAIYGSLEQKTYEITLGGLNNTRCYIRENAEGPKRAEAITRGILKGEESRDFWVSWKDGIIQVGEGNEKGKNRIMYWRVPARKIYSINCLSVSTDSGSEGQWEFVDILYPEKDKAKRRAKARACLLWLAKKQKLLYALEDAYPESIPTPDLLKLANIKQSDMFTAIVMLKGMEKKDLIQEVTTGVWMRKPGGQNHQQHEVKIVTDMPRLTGKEQPTVGIVTALYCEKQAVDAMIENKTTYVKYSAKTKGDSSVYTIGKIGKIKVVCTKLSRVGRGRGEAIAAGNAITRLLGTFSRIEHVIVTGVGGAVPNPGDYEKHVRLGDLVVSFAAAAKDPVYIHCDKMEPVNGEYNFLTRTWFPKERAMQGVAMDMQEMLAEHRTKYPWETFIDEGKEAMSSEESGFYKPASRNDRIFVPNSGGSLIEYEHPQPPPGHYVREGQPRIHFGAFGAGRFVSRNDRIREDFSNLCGVIAYDYEFYAVMESLEGNRCDSFIVIRGMADYADGTKQKDWQPYSSLVAAAFTKAFVMAIPE
ncbi:uncharacterized protein LOC135493677 [Lineus longissimus]|uniref:uncharacterized protein LOC135493677 n=1 Tax=Lineus longissimus TaxID=88925 RepID=UPI002B4DD729